MKVVGIIPGRMRASRFPGKPLIPILGVSLLGHVYKRACLSKLLHAVYIATPDQEIAEEAKVLGAPVVMTSPLHERCTDRIAEATLNLDAEIIVNIQGDEPLIHPEMVDLAVEPLLADSTVQCANLVAPIHSMEEFNDPNQIKCVLNHKNKILYFSRIPIPFHRNKVTGPLSYKQVCIMAMKREILTRFSRLAQTPLEKQESVDMLRFLENGIPIQAVLSKYSTHAVDVPEDVPLVESLMIGDPIYKSKGF